MSVQKHVIEVEARSGRGKGDCRRLRAAGRIPGNVYGLDREPFAVSVAPRAIEELLRTDAGRNAMITLSMGGSGETRQVLIRELQRDPLSESLLHIDFLRLDVTKPIQVNVPVRLTGVPLGVKNDGGILDFVHREVQVSCLPADIPGHMDLDVSELHVGQHVSVADIRFASGVSPVDPPDTIIAVVSAPRREEVAAEAAEAEAPAEEEAKPAGTEAKPAGKQEGPSKE